MLSNVELPIVIISGIILGLFSLYILLTCYKRITITKINNPLVRMEYRIVYSNQPRPVANLGN